MTLKIEWLNDELTRAKITKGWFRKRYAVVECRPEVSGGATHVVCSTCLWFYEDTDIRYNPLGKTGQFMWYRRLDAEVARDLKAIRDQWHPVINLAKARMRRPYAGRPEWSLEDHNADW